MIRSLLHRITDQPYLDRELRAARAAAGGAL